MNTAHIFEVIETVRNLQRGDEVQFLDREMEVLLGTVTTAITREHHGSIVVEVGGAFWTLRDHPLRRGVQVLHATHSWLDTILEMRTIAVQEEPCT